MCTVTFIARKNGYALAMNRDEKLSRVAGRPPAKKTVNGRTVLSPSEPGGGTWIALNDSNATLALINWYSIKASVKGETVSRGKVVNAVNSAGTPDLVDSALARMSLEKTNPFRLIGFFSATGEIAEWRWNLKQLVRKNHPWKTQQWISSGFNEPAAQRVRSKEFERALKHATAGSLAWLRRLHRSHLPQPGPFSTCMHRDEAATVSYTEVAASPQGARMRHCAGAPCQCRALHLYKLGRNILTQSGSSRRLALLRDRLGKDRQRLGA
jgi:hypothetical protein